MPFYVSMGRRRSSLSNLSSNNSPYRYVSPDGNNVWKGPRKICCFCTLAIVFPALLISVPLLMRFVLYGSSLHYLSASDMKMVDQRISTIWCQAETVRINTSFTVYVTEGEPSVVETPTPLSVERNLIIPADHKEYWGFYLLKGSRFKIRTCARWKGGTLLVVQGRNNLERCAYLGEADSAGDSDQVSSSNSAELLNKVLSHSQEEMTGLLTRIRQYIKSNPKNYGRLKKNLSNWLLVEDDAKNSNGETSGGNQHTPDMSTDSPIDILRTLIELESSNSSVARFGNHSGEELLNAILGPSPKNGTEKPPSTTNLGMSLELLANTMEVGTIRRNRRQVAEIRKKTESGENGAFEDESRDDEDDGFEIMESVHPRMKYLTSPKPHTPSSIWEGKDGHHRGVLNDTFDPNDGSNSESESVFRVVKKQCKTVKEF
ncbi:hypothetical protein Ocin01_00491 [Orchesella cincta]|uniref:E3 ubiquitin-protein ligase APD1-4 N-terminal domain-containing protein n=1 Tax=Orchesella cincta TaxID=48709 RepID=A0A1D2NLN7_ORCCI|nr:hypothetical protein Ocin01_00491 [Orchesella cincta]